jgi:hypothetical protein
LSILGIPIRVGAWHDCPVFVKHRDTPAGMALAEIRTRPPAIEVEFRAVPAHEGRSRACEEALKPPRSDDLAQPRTRGGDVIYHLIQRPANTALPRRSVQFISGLPVPPSESLNSGVSSSAPCSAHPSARQVACGIPNDTSKPSAVVNVRIND